MSRLWVITVAVTIAAVGALILVYGFATGGWLWALIYGTITTVALYDWLTLRKVNDSAREVADRMILPTMLVLIELTRRFMMTVQ